MYVNCRCNPFFTTVFFLGVLISPILFGWRVSILKNEIRDIRETNFTSLNATSIPPVEIACNRGRHDMNSRTVFYVGGNYSNASETIATWEKNSTIRNTCRCYRSVLIDFQGADNTTENTKIQRIDCKNVLFWKEFKITVWASNYPADESISFASPADMVHKKTIELRGFYVGIILTCVIITTFTISLLAKILIDPRLR